MKSKKIAMRSCVLSKEKLAKHELLRFVRTPESEVLVDITGKANGRGAYLKKDANIIKQAKETKVLEKILDTKIDESVYEEAIALVEDKDE